jgi:protein-tyrosine phosphatase
MGNICRSPTAHGVFRKLVGEAGMSDVIEIDSAGTHAYHVGKPPDRRSQMTALRRGIDLADLRARRVLVEDFERYDLVLAMDEDNLGILATMCPNEHGHKLRLFMEYAPDWGVREVPDPYYGGDSGFERVLDMVEAAARGLIEEIRRGG